MRSATRRRPPLGAPTTLLRQPHLRVVAAYLVVAAAYILISGQLVAVWADTREDLVRAEIYKGLGFVLVTGALLFYLTRSSFRQLQEQVEALETSEESFRALVDHAPEAIAVLDASDARVLHANASCLEILGRPADEIGGEVLCAHLSETPEPAEGCVDAMQQAVAEAAQGAHKRVECWVVRPDGEFVPCQLSVAPLAEEGGDRVIAWLTDLRATREREGNTLRRRNELAQVDRLVTLGTLVASIAHELNNPLNYVQLKLIKLEKGAGDGASREQRELILGVREGVDRILALSSQLTDFVRSTASRAERSFDLNEVVDNCIRLTRSEIQQRTQAFEVHRVPGLPDLVGDPRRIEQAVMNLLLNALQALPDRSAGVRIRTFLDEARDEIGLTVEDDGEGILPEHLKAIREPFFTTKTERGGTGLGLAVVTEVVAEAGGRLDFESEVGRGTCATMRFPIAQRVRKQPEPDQPRSRAS